MSSTNSMRCAKHPKVETNVTCSKCGKPICPKCMVQTPVGMRCKECAGNKKLPTFHVSPAYYLRAIGAGIGIAVACGFAWWALSIVLPFFLLRFLVAAGAGYAIGEVISLSVNRKRGTGLSIVGGLSAALSFAIANMMIFGLAWGGLYSIILSLLMLALAVFMAVLRLR